MNMRLAALALALVLIPGSGPGIGQVVTAIVQPAPGSMTIRFEAGSVTAEIHSMPLHNVLEEFASRTGVIFEVAQAWNPSISVVLYRTAVPEAVARIIGVGDYMAYFHADRDAAGQPRMQLVRIFPRALKGPSAGLLRLGTGVVTRSGEEKIETPAQALAILAANSKLEHRMKAVEILAASRSPEVIEALRRAVADPAPEVKVGAIEGLAGLGARNALPQIIEALRDSNAGVRHSAVEAISLLGDARNVKDLRSATRDSDPGVVNAAEMAIRRLSERRP